MDQETFKKDCIAATYKYPMLSVSKNTIPYILTISNLKIGEKKEINLDLSSYFKNLNTLKVRDILLPTKENQITNFLFDLGASSYIVLDSSYLSNFTTIERKVYWGKASYITVRG